MPDIDLSSENLKGLQPVINWSNKESLRPVLDRAIKGMKPAIRPKIAGIAFLGARPSKRALTTAIRSSRRPPRTIIGRFFKEEFLVLQYRWYKSYLRTIANPVVLVWNGTKGQRALLAEAAKELQIPVFYFELAPLPGKIAIDPKGINFSSSLPRHAKFYTEWAKRTGNCGNQDWRKLTDILVARPASNRTDVRQVQPGPETLRGNYIFVPLQVPDDTQIRVFGHWIKSMPHFLNVLDQVSHSLPSGWYIRIKEHPSADQPLETLINGFGNPRLVTDNSTETYAQVKSARSVLTINSSVGLQSFYFDKPVIVLGNSIYDLPGLAIKVSNARELQTVFSSPEDLDFDKELRSAYLNYLTQEFYPDWSDVVQGAYTLADAQLRFQQQDKLLFEILQ